jgi:hypothetical protein
MPIEQVGKFGNVIYTWLAILGVVVGGLWSMFTAHDNIGDNASELIKTNIRIDQLDIDSKEDVNIWGERSDRRYKRLMEENSELKRIGLMLNNRVMDLEKKVSNLEGRLNKY